MSKLRRSEVRQDLPAHKIPNKLGNVAAFMHYEHEHPAVRRLEVLRQAHASVPPKPEEALREVYEVLARHDAVADYETWSAAHGGYAGMWPLDTRLPEAI